MEQCRLRQGWFSYSCPFHCCLKLSTHLLLDIHNLSSEIAHFVRVHLHIVSSVDVFVAQRVASLEFTIRFFAHTFVCDSVLAQNSSIASDSVSLVSSSESQLKLDSKRNHFRAFVCFGFMWIMMDKIFLNS